ncbi:MAG TPA: transketolase C-terminal domain-containing protein, partial [Gemmatimonadaceae bacterium]|nr:transketolase C-terminal domain-containing protein [Gemmatimonadaceae bacterium]
NNTAVKAWHDFTSRERTGRYLHYGIREHAMAAVMSGMALHRGVLPYGGTFLIFSDYMRPSVRLASLMGVHVVYVFTHDSIGLGEDGPTHQPIEQLSALRAIPNLVLLRPADATETADAWRVAVTLEGSPVAMVLTRQKLPLLPRDRGGAATREDVARGGYVLADAEGGAPEVVLVSSGSEVSLVMQARTQLASAGIRARVVSVPSHELFFRQPEEYRATVLPTGIPRVSIEAAHPMCWYRIIGTEGVAIGLERYGASAPYQTIYRELGITADRVVEAAKRLVSGARA